LQSLSRLQDEATKLGSDYVLPTTLKDTKQLSPKYAKTYALKFKVAPLAVKKNNMNKSLSITVSKTNPKPKSWST
jgi:hypothetical protein